MGCSECSGRVLIAISTHTWCWSGGLDILNFVFDTFGKSFIDILRMTILVILLTRCVNNFCPTPKASESSCCPKVSMSILRMSAVGGVLGAIWATSAPGPSQHRTQLRGAGPCHDHSYHVFILSTKPSDVTELSEDYQMKTFMSLICGKYQLIGRIHVSR